MQPSADAIVSHTASIEIDASPEAVYALVSDITRMGEWSPEAVGGRWHDGATGRAGDWFTGVNENPDRTWERDCEVAQAEPGADFTFVVGGVAENCTWWSYELEPTDAGTVLRENWWIVNKTPAIAAATPEQFDKRVAYTHQMIDATLAAIKATAEA